MTTYQDVFERYEKKYLLDEGTCAAFMARLAGRMQQDAYGRYTISNLYLDTENYDLIRTSLEKPVYKEKLRLRSYGVPREPEDAVFLELKKKYRGVVYKRRISLPLQQAENYLLRGITPDTMLAQDAPPESVQIFQEIDWCMRLYRPRPRVYIAYDRIALFCAAQPDLRMTFDRNIRFRQSQLHLQLGDEGESLLKPGFVLMELKIPGAIPLWLSKDLAELGIFPVSFSKYGMCYQQSLCGTGGIVCA